MNHKDLKKRWQKLLESRVQKEHLQSYHGYDDLPDYDYDGYDSIEGGDSSGGDFGGSSFDDSSDMLESDPVKEGRKDWKKIMEVKRAHKLLQEVHKLAVMFDKLSDNVRKTDNVNDFEEFMVELINLDKAFEEEFGDKVTFGNHFASQWTSILKLIDKYGDEADPEVMQALQPVIKRNGTKGIDYQLSKMSDWIEREKKRRLIKQKRFTIELGKQIAKNLDKQLTQYTLNLIEEEDLFRRFIKGIIRGLKTEGRIEYKFPITSEQLESPIEGQNDIETISEIGEIMGELLSELDKEDDLSEDFLDVLKSYMKRFKDQPSSQKEFLKDISRGVTQTLAE